MYVTCNGNCQEVVRGLSGGCQGIMYQEGLLDSPSKCLSCDRCNVYLSTVLSSSSSGVCHESFVIPVAVTCTAKRAGDPRRSTAATPI